MAGAAVEPAMTACASLKIARPLNSVIKDIIRQIT
jgi:hypothetical protein